MGTVCFPAAPLPLAMVRHLADSVLVITGASSGIGAAVAVEAARAGMNLVLTARRADRLAQVAEQARRSRPANGASRSLDSAGSDQVTSHQPRGGVEIVTGDVTDPGHSQRLIDAALARFGRVDAVLANAGYGLETSTLHMSSGELRRIFEVNVFAAFELLQVAGRYMVERGGGGHLLMSSSCVAKITMPYYAAYCATKAAQNHLCRALRLELRPHGVEVSSILPVSTTTEFHRVATGEDRDAPQHTPRFFVQPPERVARAVLRCLRRPSPEVWTSHTVRFASALMTMFPSLMDWSVRKEVAKRRGRVMGSE